MTLCVKMIVDLTISLYPQSLSTIIYNHFPIIPLRRQRRLPDRNFVHRLLTSPYFGAGPSPSLTSTSLSDKGSSPSTPDSDLSKKKVVFNRTVSLKEDAGK